MQTERLLACSWPHCLRALPVAAVLLCLGCYPFGSGRDVSAADPFRQRRLAEREAARSGVVPASHEAPVEAEKKPLSVGDFSPDNISDTVVHLAGYGPDKEIAKQLYREAETVFREAAAEDDKSKYDDAAAKYAAAAKRWPNSALEEDALWMVGESLFFARRYPKAAAAYDALIKKFRNTRHLDKVGARRYVIAQYWLDLNEANPRWTINPNFTDSTRPRFDTFGSGAKLFEQIPMDDARGKLADDATMAAAGAFFAAGKYARAAKRYEDLRKSFPNSDHQFRAHLLGIYCMLKIYRGPDYDGAALDEADYLVRRTWKQFPQQAAAEKEYLEKAMMEVRAQKAERHWRQAQYYEGRGEYGGARVYYNAIVRDFPNSSTARLARQRLDDIQDRPDRPPERMTWLADQFPKEEKEKPLLSEGFWWLKWR